MTLPNFFVGVWAQPVESFPKWKAEGVNLIVMPDPSFGNTAQQRRAACAANQLYYHDVPQSVTDVEALVNDPWCRALMVQDEPEIKANELGYWYTDPKYQPLIDAYIAKWKPIFDAVKGRKPIWCNFGGGHVINARPWYVEQLLTPFVNNLSVSELSCDLYPISEDFKNSWDGWNVNPPNPNSDPFIVKGDIEQVYALKLLKNYFPGREYWAYLDVQMYQPNNVNGRQPTAADIQLQFDQMIKNGVKGVVYFATRTPPTTLPWDPAGANGKTSWDGRTDAQTAKCKEIAMKLTGAPVVVTPPSDLQKQLDDLKARVVALEAKKVPSGVQLVY